MQTDGVAIGSPLGPILAGIFMVKLETTIVPTLDKILLKWKRYVDDTFCFVKIGSVNHILRTLNSLHQNIQFTFEVENDNKLPFLDVLLIRTTTPLKQLFIENQQITIFT